MLFYYQTTSPQNDPKKLAIYLVINMETITSNSAGNVIDKLLKFGVKNKLIIEKYINFNALENDTFSLLEPIKEPMSQDDRLTIINTLIDMWYPAASAVIDEQGSGWSHSFDLDLEVGNILTSQGYKQIEEGDDD